MISTPSRREAVMLIQEANRAGARLAVACQAANISIRTYERWIEGSEIRGDGRPTALRPVPANKLSIEEEQSVIATVNQPEYASKPPSQIVPALADKGVYIASESTFYRILRKHKLLQHRGRTRLSASKPPTTHIATGPNQVWSWDITYLPGPILGSHYKLYVIMDIFSRKIVGWEIWNEERAEYAVELIRRAKYREKAWKPLVLHSDNGSPMKAATLQATLTKLGITASYSRPRVSNDNPFSEAGFKTLKYRPNYPSKGFQSINHARQWVHECITWYHEEHRHSGICYVTPLQRHTGEASAIMDKRTNVYTLARLAHPERWTRSIRKWILPDFVALNPERQAALPSNEQPALNMAPLIAATP
jgi:Transposase and inactivated derivatives